MRYTVYVDYNDPSDYALTPVLSLSYDREKCRVHVCIGQYCIIREHFIEEKSRIKLPPPHPGVGIL
jgi:hypothetical protein